MKVFIDGHNALGALDIRGRTHEERRHALMSRVAGLAPGATVFFDAGRAPEGLFEREALHGILAVYCREREADDFIIDAVRDAANPAQITVVTNDRQIAGTARQHGAKSVAVEEFFRERRSAPGSSPTVLKQPRRRYVKFSFDPSDFGLPDEVDLANPPDLDDASPDDG
jgi:predicted RNA-binding protein with PIN domain